MADTPVKCTPDGKDFSIWCIPANFNYFVTSPLTPDTVDGVVNKSTTVKAHYRKRFVGDLEGSNVKTHSRDYMYDPGRKVGNALPGFSFILDDGIEKRQFTLDGNVMDLHAYLVSQLKVDVKLYTQGGRYDIAKAEGGD